MSKQQQVAEVVLASRKGELPAKPAALLKRSNGFFADSGRYLPLVYLAICIPTVLFLLFFRQPLGTPDEFSHIARAYQISKGVWLTEEAVPGSNPKGLVDRAWIELNSEVHKRRFESLETALPDFQTYGWSGIERLRNFNSSVYFPAAFIPQAVGLKIAQALNLPLVRSLQLVSVLNAASCLLLIALAIHLAAEGKFFIALIGALPMSIHQLTSASPDGILNAAALLLFAIAITAVTRSTVSRPAFWGVTLLGIILATTKTPYLPLALATLAVLWRVEKSSAKTNFRYVLAGMLMIGTPLLWMHISNASAVKHNLLLQTKPSDQIGFLLSHPLVIPRLALMTLSAFWRDYVGQIIGVLGWADAPLPRVAYIVLGLGLTATALMEGITIQAFPRSIIALGIVVSVGLTFLGLYLVWNPLASLDPIQGVQGRYFLPILPFLLFLIPKPRRAAADGLKMPLFILFGTVGGVATIMTIMTRYYA